MYRVLIKIAKVEIYNPNNIKLLRVLNDAYFLHLI